MGNSDTRRLGATTLCIVDKPSVVVTIGTIGVLTVSWPPGHVDANEASGSVV